MESCTASLHVIIGLATLPNLPSHCFIGVVKFVISGCKCGGISGINLPRVWSTHIHSTSYVHFMCFLTSV